MYATTRDVWELKDASQTPPTVYSLPPGRYELERIPCPLGHDCNWLVLKGTKIGMAEGFWRGWPPKVIDGKPIERADDIIIEE